MSKIRMGNDELITYIRKWNTACQLTNDVLGRKIWEWIEEHDTTARQLSREECKWGKNAKHVDARELPYTATQFEFDRGVLIRL